MKWSSLNTINIATACSMHAFRGADNALHMMQQIHTPKFIMLSLHSRVDALFTSPCCWKDAETIQPPGLQLPGLRASTPPAQAGETSPSSGDTGCPQSCCGCCLYSSQCTSCVGHSSATMAGQPGGQRGLGWPHYWLCPVLLTLSAPKDGCIKIACEICSDISLLLYYRFFKK